MSKTDKYKLPDGTIDYELIKEKFVEQIPALTDTVLKDSDENLTKEQIQEVNEYLEYKATDIIIDVFIKKAPFQKGAFYFNVLILKTN